jgi:hypothetical protein
MGQKTEDPKIYIPITRIDEDKRMVYGYGTREDVKDSFGTIVDLGSVEGCLPDYMKYRNIREMHQMSAVGRAAEITVDEKGVYLGVKVVDDDAWLKVKEKVYNGFSIGAKKDKQIDDRLFIRSITEFSLVDRPSNEGCQIDEYRIFPGGEKMEEKIFEWKSADGLLFRIAYIPEGDGTLKATTLQDALATLNIVRVEVPEPKPAPAPAPAMPDLKRYLGEEVWDAQVAMEALLNITYLLDKELMENHPEAARQAADLKAVVEKLKAFIASEIMEVNMKTPASPVIAMAAGILDDVFRKGSRHSAGDLKRIQDIHDHCAALGCRCEAVEKGDSPDVTRIASLETDLTAAKTEITTLTKDKTDLIERVKALEAEPAPAKGPLNTIAVTKEKDGAHNDVQRVEDSDEYKAATASKDPMAVARVVAKHQLMKPMRVSAG